MSSQVHVYTYLNTTIHTHKFTYLNTNIHSHKHAHFRRMTSWRGVGSQVHYARIPKYKYLQTQTHTLQAYEELERRELPGSCTVCLALYTGNGLMHVLNLGDSGIHVVRDGMSVFSTNEQQVCIYVMYVRV